MSYERVGGIILTRNCQQDFKNYSAVYKIHKGRNEFRIPRLQLCKLNPNYKVKYNFKLIQNERLTIHKQNGLYFYLDVTKVYYNSRYATCRLLVSSLVKDSRILVLGDGIGPYSVYLAKNNESVIGYDLNKCCIQFAKVNKRINKTYNYFPILGNIAEVPKLDINVIVSIVPTLILKYIFSFGYLPYRVHYCIILLNHIQVIVHLLEIIGNFKVTYKFIKSYCKTARNLSINYTDKKFYGLTSLVYM